MADFDELALKNYGNYDTYSTSELIEVMHLKTASFANKAEKFRDSFGDNFEEYIDHARGVRKITSEIAIRLRKEINSKQVDGFLDLGKLSIKKQDLDAFKKILEFAAVVSYQGGIDLQRASESLDTPPTRLISKDVMHFFRHSGNHYHTLSAITALERQNGSYFTSRDHLDKAIKSLDIAFVLACGEGGHSEDIVEKYQTLVTKSVCICDWYQFTERLVTLTDFDNDDITVVIKDTITQSSDYKKEQEILRAGFDSINNSMQVLIAHRHSIFQDLHKEKISISFLLNELARTQESLIRGSVLQNIFDISSSYRNAYTNKDTQQRAFEDAAYKLTENLYLKILPICGYFWFVRTQLGIEESLWNNHDPKSTVLPIMHYIDTIVRGFIPGKDNNVKLLLLMAKMADRRNYHRDLLNVLHQNFKSYFDKDSDYSSEIEMVLTDYLKATNLSLLEMIDEKKYAELIQDVGRGVRRKIKTRKRNFGQRG